MLSQSKKVDISTASALVTVLQSVEGLTDRQALELAAIEKSLVYGLNLG